MILKEECKKVGYSVTDFSELVDVPVQTLRDWCKSRPVLMEVIFEGLAANNILDRVDELRSEYHYTLDKIHNRNIENEQPTAGERHSRQ